MNTYELREYQEEAVGRIKNKFGRSSEALLEMASGLGKTIVAADLSRNLIVNNDKKRGLFLVHETGLLRQAKSEFRKTVGLGFSFGIFNGEIKNVGANIVFGTFQSMREGKHNFPRDYFDFIVVDEAHHSWARTFKDVLDYFDYDYLLGMTATPIRGDGQKIQEIFGDPVYSIPLEDGVRMGWLVPFEYHLMTDDLTQGKLEDIVEQAKEDPRLVSMSNLNHSLFIEKRDEEIIDIIRNHQGKEKKKTIIFTQTISHCDEIAELIPEAEPYHCGIRVENNYENLEKFRNGGLNVLIAVDKFNEGIDIPDAELIVFLRRTQSKRIFLQQLGRGLRRAPGKDKVSVLDFTANLQRLKYVKGLAENLKRLSDFSSEQEGKDTELRDQIHVKGKGFEFIFEKETLSLFELLETIEQNLGFYDNLEKAKEAVKELEEELSVRIDTAVKYHKYYKQDPQLPSEPQNKYSEQWESWQNFLRTDPYLTLKEAKKAVGRIEEEYGVEINTREDYFSHYKKDPRLRCHLPYTYPDQWERWDFFLGSLYPTLEEAKQAVRTLEKKHNINIDSVTKYHEHYQKDPRLPSHPLNVYSAQWKNWKTFLEKFYLSLDQAKQAVKDLEREYNIKIDSMASYKKHRSKDPQLPGTPHRVYSEEWENWYDFLDTSEPRFYSNLQQAKEAVKDLERKYDIQINERRKYHKYYKKDPLLPSIPSNAYPKEWKSWQEFLDTKTYPTLEEAKQAIRELEREYNITVNTYDQYYEHYHKDPKLSGDPRVKYSQSWQGWKDYFGVESRELSEPYSSLKEAKQAVVTLEEKYGIEIATSADYFNHYKKNPKLRYEIWEEYPEKWQGWDRFLEKDPYSTLEEAKRAVLELEERLDVEIDSCSKYSEYFTEDPRLRANPKRIYSDEWIDWYDFLNKERPEE